MLFTPRRRSSRHARRKPVTVLVTAAVVLSLILTACGGSSKKSSDVSGGGGLPVKLVSYTSGAAAWIGYIGKQKGFFAKDGINLNLVTLPGGGAQATTALLSGDLDIANLDLNNLGPALAQGQKYKLLVNEYVNNWQIVTSAKDANETIEQALPQLQTVGVPSLGGSGTKFVKYLAQAYGSSGSKIKYVADPNGAAMVAGQTKATATDVVGGCVLAQQGFKSVFSFLDLKQDKSTYPQAVQALIGLPALSYWSSGAWADKHPTEVKDFQKAVEDTIAWVKDPANGDEVAKILLNTVWHVSSLPADAWTACVKNTVKQFDPAFPASAVDTWNTFVKANGAVPGGLPPSSQWLAAGIPQK